MAEETIWLLGIDGEEALGTLDALTVAAFTLLDAFNQVAGAASGLSAIDEALSTVATEAASVAEEADIASVSLSSMAASADAIAGIGGVTEEAIAGIGGVTEEATAASASLGAVGTSAGAMSSEWVAGIGAVDEKAGIFSSLFSGIQDGFSSFSDAVEKAQWQLQIFAMAGIMAGKSLFDAGIQGQQGIALVQGMAGATNQDVQNLEQSALSLGDSMGEATAGFYQVASAGYVGGGAIQVFTAATEAAKGAQADLQPVSTALTSIMAAYSDKADQAKTVTDQMTEAVFVGKQSFQAFASAIGPLAATGHNVGLSFAEVAAAEATMTQINPNVRQDTMELNSLFTNMDMSMDKVAQAAKKLKIPFDEAHYSSLNLIDKLKYLADISGGTNTVAFQKMVGGVNGVKAALALLSNQGDTYTTDLQKIQNSQGATDKAFERSEQTVKAHMDHMGAAFSVFSTKFMDAVGPHLIPILDNLGKAMDWLSQHMDVAMPIAAGLAVVLGGVLVTALVALIAPLFAIAIPIAGMSVPLLAIVAAIALVVAGVGLLITHWHQVTSVFQNFVGGIGQKVTDFFDILAHGVDKATADARDKAHQHTLEMKDKVLKNTEELDLGAIQKLDHMRMGIEDQLRQTTDAAQRHTLEMKLKVVTNAEEMHEKTWEAHKQMHKHVQDELDLMKNGISTTTMSAADIAQAHSLLLKDRVVNNAIATDNQTIQKFDDMRQGILEQLKQTKDGAEKHALEIKLTETTHAEQAAKDVRDKHVKMRTDVESELDKLKHSASNTFGNIGKDIQTAVGNVTSWIKDAWDNAVKWVVGKFEWLYDHNYYFKDLVDFIIRISRDVSNFLKGTWETIKNDASASWNWLVSKAEWLWDQITQPFRDAWSHIGPPLNDLWNNVKGVWNGFVTDAENFGKNLINSIADGIRAAASNVSKAASDVAGDIAKFLGFHSPAAEGPGHDADRWAPAFIDMFAAGIESRQSHLQSAIQNAAGQLAGSFNPQLSSSLSVATVPSVGGNDQHTQLLQQAVVYLAQMVQLQQQRQGNFTLNNTIQGGSINTQMINQLVQLLSGYSYESQQRGVG